jgi:hypothetical protein
MEKIAVEVFSRTTNCPVIRYPRRQFPGILIQGDSLKNLHSIAQTVTKQLQHSRPEEALDTAVELLDLLSGYMQAYEATLKSNGLKLPYPEISAG